jgi:hypothetical protein
VSVKIVTLDAFERASIQHSYAAADDRVPPHSLDAERSVLGAMLMDAGAIVLALGTLAADDFFRDAHRWLFAAMRRLHDRDAPIDLVTLREELSARELDEIGPAYISALIDGVPHSMNVEHYARIVKNRAIFRSLIASIKKTLAVAYAAEDEPGAVLDGAQRTLQSIADATADAAGNVSESLSAAVGRLSEATSREPVLGDLLALGEIAMFHGQPRDGKTWASLEVAIAVATGGPAFDLERLTAQRARGVLILSNEDGERAMVGRIQMLLSGRRIWTPPPNFHLIVGQGCDLDAPVWQRRLIQEVRRLAIGLVILDPIRSLTGCVDQGPHELQPFARYLRSLLREADVAILLVHHDAKPTAGVTDNRRRAQRASGGAIFSIVDAPMHVERVDARRSLVAPDGFKFCPDPEPFVFERVAADDGVSLRLIAGTGLVIPADTGLATKAADIALQAKLEGFLREKPGWSGRAIAKGMKMQRQMINAALQRMLRAGLVGVVDGSRNAKLWTLR